MSETAHTPGTVIGSLREEGGRGVVRMEDRFATDPADLWRALTEPARLARWIADVSGDLRPGGQVRAEFTSGWSGMLRVDVCDAPHRLVVASDPGSPEETVIEALLEERGAGTVLVVEERGLPLGVLPDHGAGWHVHMEDLGAYLAGTATSHWPTRAAELHARYEA